LFCDVLVLVRNEGVMSRLRGEMAWLADFVRTE